MNLKQHAVLTFAALLAGTAAVWWLEPQTVGGTTFVVTGFVLLFNAIAAVLPRRS